MFRKSFSFSGRIRRLEYGLSLLIYYALIGGGQYLIDTILSDSEQASKLLAILILPLLWAIIAQGTKRCHDLGKTGWFQLIPFYILWMVFAVGENGINQYGPNPKGIGNIDEIDEIGNELVN